MRCTGIVEKTEGHQALVKMDHNQCGECKSCVSMTGHDFTEDIEVEVENDIDARPGDRVVMEMPSGKVYKAYMKVFWMPVAALAAGYALGALAIAPLLGISAQATGAILAVVAGLFFFWLGVRMTRKTGLKPDMLRKAGDGEGIQPSQSHTGPRGHW